MLQPSRARRVVAGAAVSALAFSGVVSLSALPAGALPTFDLERVSGQNRFETSAATALEAFPDGSDTVIIARGDLFADALAGSYLTPLGPVLLVQQDQVPQTVLDAIDDLGATEAIILGGTAAVQPGVQTQLEGEGLTVRRISGQNRAETAVAIANTDRGDGADDPDTAIVVRDNNFADALSLGPLSAFAGFPVLLTDSQNLSPATAQALDDLGISDVIIGGGTAAVSQTVEDQIDDIVDGDTSRVSGQTRYETSAEAAELLESTVDEVDGSSAILANGRNNFGGADALSGVALALQTGSPIVLTSENPDGEDGTEQYFTDNSDTLVDGFALGGTAPLPDEVVDLYEELGRGDADLTATLEDADDDGTNDDSRQAGDDVEITLTVDPAAVLGSDGFESVTFTGDEVEGGSVTFDADADGSFDDDDDSDGLTFTVPLADDAEDGTATVTATATLADDSDDDPFDEGDDDDTISDTVDVVIAADGGGGGVDAAAGERPVLVSASSEQNDDDEFEVTYTFDREVALADSDDDGDVDGDDDDLDTDDFVLIAEDGSRFTPDSVEFGDDGSSVVATFGSGDVDDTNADTVRLAAVEFAAVADGEDDAAATPAENPICSVGINLLGGPTFGDLEAGRTVAPDLLSIDNARTSGPNDDISLVDVTFDEAVETVGENDRFVLVPQSGDRGVTPDDVTVSSSDPSTVVLSFDAANSGNVGGDTVADRFDDGDFSRFYVRDDLGTVNTGGSGSGTDDGNDDNDDADGTGNAAVEDADGNENPLQSVDVANGGNTATPDLVEAEFLGAQDDDDTATAVDETQDRAVYTFDEDVTTTVVGDKFKVYDFNGTTTVAETGSATRTAPREVTVEFEPGSLGGAVGASIEPLAVTATDSTAGNTNGQNVRDEVPVGPTTDLGQTDGPDLVSVTTSRDAAGDTTVTFEFDEGLVGFNGSRFAVYGPDGTRYVTVSGGTRSGSEVSFETEDFRISTDDGEDPDGDTPGDAALFGATLGTVDNQAVGSSASEFNPEGCVAVTQGQDDSPDAGTADTDAPQVVSFTAGENGSNFRVVFTLDEAVEGPVSPDDVELVTAKEGLDNLSPDTATVSSDGTQITATFNGEDEDSLADYRLVTLLPGAVSEPDDGVASTDELDNVGFSGAFDSGSEALSTGEAGRTVGPDLISIDNFRVNAGVSNDQTLVDFTFDEDVTTAGANDRFVLVRESGTSGVTPISTTVDGDVITATYARPSGEDTIADQQDDGEFPRGYVRPGAAVDDDGDANVLQAAAIEADRTTGTPDLVSAAIVLGEDEDDTTTSVDETADRVAFTFDEGVLAGQVDGTSGTNLDEELFQVSTFEGDTFVGNRAFRTGSSEVTVEFDDGELGAAVVASIEVRAPGDGAVVESDDTGAEQDESVRDAVDLDNANSNGTTGATAGPDLVSVATNTDGTATFTFDDEVETGSLSALAGEYRLYLQDGTEAEGTAITEVDDTSITVEFDTLSNTQVANASIGSVDAGSTSNAGDCVNPFGSVVVDGVDDNDSD